MEDQKSTEDAAMIDSIIVLTKGERAPHCSSDFDSLVCELLWRRSSVALSFRFCVKMRHQLASTTTLDFTESRHWWMLIAGCLVLRADFALAHGPDVYEVLPTWPFSMANCSLFRNETVLRPLFRVWPENIPGVPFRYCCEYQPGVSSLPNFNLSSYAYSAGSGSLLPVPYYDVGLVDKHYTYYWSHWSLWWLLSKQFSSPMIYCDVTDMQMLYRHRWLKSMIRGAYSVLIAFCMLLISILAIRYYKVRSICAPGKCEKSGQSLSIWEGWASWNKLRKECLRQTNRMELASDVCHILLLTLVGNCVMEGIAHSPIRMWKSQLMFNMGVTYTYLTLFTFISTIIRHSLNPNLNHGADCRWQKVIWQFAALFVMSGYLQLVEDVSEHSLDAVMSLVLATCVVASVWSGGEIVIILQFLGCNIISYCWRKQVLPCLFGIETSPSTAEISEAAATNGDPTSHSPSSTPLAAISIVATSNGNNPPSPMTTHSKKTNGPSSEISGQSGPSSTSEEKQLGTTQ